MGIPVEQMCTLGGWPVSRGAPSISRRNDEFYRDLLLLEFFLFRKRCFENCYYQMDKTTISFPRSNPSTVEIQFVNWEKGINDTKFKQTRRWCVFIRMEIWSILSREERNDNIVPSIVFGQVNNPLSTIEHWMTGPNIPRLTTYFVG